MVFGKAKSVKEPEKAQAAKKTAQSPEKKEKRKKINFSSPEYRIRIVKEYSKLWSDFFRSFTESMRERKISESDEESFFQIVSLLSVNHYRFEMMADNFMKDSDKILDVLSEAINLHYLKSMSEAQFSRFEVDWHSLFIAMNKCLGKLIGLLPPEKAEQLEK